MTALAAAGRPESRFTRLFAYPFRIFFLSAAVLSVTAIPAWLWMLFGSGQAALGLSPLQWHQHEMLFGFLDAAIAGFLLTAICNWTGTKALHGVPLAALWTVWLAARILVLLRGVPEWLVVGVDLAFLPLVTLDAGRRIWTTHQYRQLPVLVVLTLLWLMDAGFHLSGNVRFVYGAIVMAMTLMLVIGGRITPAFSSNWLRLAGGDPSAIVVVPALERMLLPTMLLLLVSVVFDLDVSIRVVLAMIACVASTVRLLLWQGWRVRGEPLLWILHAALAWIPVSLLLMAGHAVGCVPSSAWVHAAAVGAMGSLILGVMSRVSLGHTGRPLRVPLPIAMAFAIVLCAGAARVATALRLLDWQFGLLLAGVLWTAAFGTFLVHYAPILSAPRTDGKDG